MATLLFPSSATAQRVSTGIVLGGSLTDGFRDHTYYDFFPPAEPGAPWSVTGTRFWSPSKDYVAGGMVELHFKPHWSLEVNGLFRQLSGKWGTVVMDGSTQGPYAHPVVTWQFPVLAKYRFQDGKWNPFIEAGPSFRTAGNLNSSDPSHHGLTAGTGFEVHWGKFRIAPTVRYTLWAGDHNPGGAHTRPDQVELLVKFSRRAQPGGHALGRNISLGATIGTNLTGDYGTSNLAHEGNPPIIRTAGPRNFIFGPSIEIRLPDRFSVQVDALHRTVSSATETTFEGVRYRSTYRAVTWVFPVLAKYRIRGRGLDPFIAAGPSFRLRQTLAEASDASPYGATVAAGVEMQAGPMRLVPSVRYTYWAPDRQWFSGRIRNQVEAYIGFSF